MYYKLQESACNTCMIFCEALSNTGLGLEMKTIVVRSASQKSNPPYLHKGIKWPEYLTALQSAIYSCLCRRLDYHGILRDIVINIIIIIIIIIII